jgi:UDP-N-acetylglucosamine 2-epimerase (non-hydrolysing)
MKQRRFRIIAAFGTRPEAIKMAPVILALQQEPDFSVKTIVTGQHREMLDQVLDLFKLTPEYDLNIMTPGQNPAGITGCVLQKLTPILDSEKPDLLLAHGDTTTTFASSLAAFYQGIKVAHVEAGLRTGDKRQPFPEELNRLLTGQIADLHFAPTNRAKENLARENIPPQTIFVTGNTVIDALFQCLATSCPETSCLSTGNITPSPAGNISSEKMILVTAHRRENWGSPLENIITALKIILADNPDVKMLIPVHLNPIVRNFFKTHLGSEPRVTLTEPLDYRQMVMAMFQAYLIITDSGGIQEEAPALGKPVLVLRNKTERPEAIMAGTVKLVGTDPETISQSANLLLKDHVEYQRMAKATNPYGDGKASARIAAGLKYYFELTPDRPADFTAVNR